MAVAKILAETKAEREAEEKAGGPIEHKRPHRRGCGNLGFKNLAQTIADRWKVRPPIHMNVFNSYAITWPVRFVYNLIPNISLSYYHFTTQQIPNVTHRI